MNVRGIVHAIVDQLPESELPNAARLLKALEQPADPLELALTNAPPDDEPFDPSDIEYDDEEPSIPHDEVVRRFLK
jgi:hypothetical protein